MLKKNINLMVVVLTKLQTAKDVVKCLKRAVSEDPTTSNTEKVLNTVEICKAAPLPDSLINMKEIELGIVSLSDV